MYAHYYDVLQPYFSGSKTSAESGNRISDEKLEDVFRKIAHAIDNLSLDEMEACARELEGYSYDEEETRLYNRLCDAVAEMDPDICEAVIADWRKLRS